LAQRVVGAASLVEESASLLEVGDFHRLAKHRLFARDLVAHSLRAYLSCASNATQ
jgi:hypothetical protein